MRRIILALPVFILLGLVASISHAAEFPDVSKLSEAEKETLRKGMSLEQGKKLQLFGDKWFLMSSHSAFGDRSELHLMTKAESGGGVMDLMCINNKFAINISGGFIGTDDIKNKPLYPSEWSRIDLLFKDSRNASLGEQKILNHDISISGNTFTLLDVHARLVLANIGMHDKFFLRIRPAGQNSVEQFYDTSDKDALYDAIVPLMDACGELKDVEIIFKK